MMFIMRLERIKRDLIDWFKANIRCKFCEFCVYRCKPCSEDCINGIKEFFKKEGVMTNDT